MLVINWCLFIGKDPRSVSVWALPTRLTSIYFSQGYYVQLHHFAVETTNTKIYINNFCSPFRRWCISTNSWLSTGSSARILTIWGGRGPCLRTSTRSWPRIWSSASRWWPKWLRHPRRLLNRGGCDWEQVGGVLDLKNEVKVQHSHDQGKSWKIQNIFFPYREKSGNFKII